MAINVYRSDDASAPLLTGTAGSLIALLDACLVNGYGSKAAAGWEKSFSGTLKAAYRPAQGNRMYLRVDDSVAQYPRLRGYETMSDVDTGSEPFPTDTQQSGGAYGITSITANSTARPWMLFADEYAFYLWVAQGGTTLAATQSYTDVMFFGDLVSYKPADQYATMLVARVSGNGYASSYLFSLTTSTAAISGHWLARGVSGASGAATCTAWATLPGGLSVCGNGGCAYPDPASGALLLAHIPIGDTARVMRGHLPGAANVLHHLVGNHLDTATGADGESYLIAYIYPSGSEGRVALQTSGSWRN